MKKKITLSSLPLVFLSLNSEPLKLLSNQDWKDGRHKKNAKMIGSLLLVPEKEKLLFIELVHLLKKTKRKLSSDLMMIKKMKNLIDNPKRNYSSLDLVFHTAKLLLSMYLIMGRNLLLGQNQEKYSNLIYNLKWRSSVNLNILTNEPIHQFRNKQLHTVLEK